jgi:hypothetical protein
LEIGNCVMTGTIKDFSYGGVFFCPEAVVADYQLIHDDCLSTVDPGSLVNIRIGDMVIQSTIKWLGTHHGHACDGCGLEFVKPLTSAAGD